MDPTGWVEHLDDDATNYAVDDFALALIGNDTEHVTLAVPTLLMRVKHIETEVMFDFTFRLPPSMIGQMNIALDALSFDLERDCRLGDLDGHSFGDE